MAHWVEERMPTPAPQSTTGAEDQLTAQQQDAVRAEVSNTLKSQVTLPPSYKAHLRTLVVDPFLSRITSKANDMIASAIRENLQAYLHTAQPDKQRKDNLQSQIQTEIQTTMSDMETQMKDMFGDSFKTTVEAEMDKFVTAQMQKHQCPSPCFQCNFDTDSRVCTLNIPENYKLNVPKLRIGPSTASVPAASPPGTPAPTILFARALNVNGQTLCKNLDVLSVEQMSDGGTSAICCQKSTDIERDNNIYFTRLVKQEEPRAPGGA